MKKCFKCGESKPLSDYYRHSQMSDGHFGKCKACTRQTVQNNRQKNIECVRLYEVVRNQESERHKKMLARIRRWRKKYPERRQAHTTVSNAIRDGRLKRKLCEKCGRGPTQAHHDDYSKPLNVRWLCLPCHASHHQEVANGCI